MNKNQAVTGKGHNVHEAWKDAVSQHHELGNNLHYIENIVVEENGVKKVITDRDEILKFLEKYPQ